MEDDERKPSGCGLLLLYNNVFRRPPPAPAPAPRRSASTNSLPTHCTAPSIASDAHSSSKRRRSTSDDPSTAVSGGPAPLNSKAFANHNYPKAPASTRPTPMQGLAAGPRRAHNGCGGISMELDSMINDHQRTKGSSTLVRASSGNVMLYGNLGNLRAPGAVTPSRNVLDYLPKTVNEMNSNATNRTQQGYGGMNGPNPTANSEAGGEPEVPGVMCRALSTRLDPEELKEMGNEEYKQGNFAEAVALYDRAIFINPEKASYWSNKAAALTAMGRLIEAVAECREAVRIDPSYHRAHHRLGTLYLRLGEGERALHHYRLSRNEASSADISRVQALQTHLSKCSEARRLKDWHSVLKETQSAVSSGADSAPQVFAFKAEALLMLRKHEEAETALSGAPNFDIDASTKFFGAMKNAFSLMVRAQVYMAAGRFEDALSVANKAARLDTNSGEAGGVARKARAVATARATGNDLFKASKFEEACVAYGEGLDHDKDNAILMCNRAACRSKIGQWEKAIRDCSAALSMRPSYSKARLRRADCNAKLERWESSIQDYEALLHEMPEDVEVEKALHEARAKLRKQQGSEGVKDTIYASDLVCVTRMDQFRHIIMSSGLSIALLFNQPSDVSKQMVPLMEQLSKRYPSVNFLKVNMEAIPGFAESEHVSLVPCFRMYKNGSGIREVLVADCDRLENYLKMEHM